jgi:transcriptional regulator with XRE-family HTH domain
MAPLTRPEFGARFKAARQAAGLTQAAAAAGLGISQPRWAEYEAGVKLPPLLRLLEIIAALDLDPRLLFPEFFTAKKRLPRSRAARRRVS